MSNERTAQEWITVKNEARSDIERVTPLLRQATNNLNLVNDKFNSLSGIENQLRGDPDKVTEFEAARNARIDYYRSAVLPARNLEQSLRDELNAAQREFNYAEEQADIALSNAPNTNTNTPPASSLPVDPTDLPPPVFNPIQNDQAILEANQEPQTDTGTTQDVSIKSSPQPVTNDDTYTQFLREFATDEVAETGVNAPYATSNTRGISGQTNNARSQANLQDSDNFALGQDWRVRLVLAENADYLYKGDNPGILEPLIPTNGIIFPYTPIIQVTYSANYDPTNITHSNYKVIQYQSSSVENVNITCDFTAQDTFEANYLLAVVHFLRSSTKMFYGQDQKPKLGTPPPLLYLKGYGAFHFDMHPLVISSFTYNLDNDVDYIRASSSTTLSGVSKDTFNKTNPNSRLSSVGIDQGGLPKPTVFSNPTSGTIEPTYVPTKVQIQIQCIPVVSRKDISDRFSFRDYATGALLRGSKNNNAGIW